MGLLARLVYLGAGPYRDTSEVVQNWLMDKLRRGFPQWDWHLGDCCWGVPLRNNTNHHRFTFHEEVHLVLHPGVCRNLRPSLPGLYPGQVGHQGTLGSNRSALCYLGNNSWSHHQQRVWCPEVAESRRYD